MRLSDGRLDAVRLAGEVQAAQWLKDWLVRGKSVAALGRLLLAPSAVAPAGFAPRGRIVCSCWNIAESEIADFAAALPGDASDGLAAAQAHLKCGTQCGSCLPELKRLLASSGPRIAA